MWGQPVPPRSVRLWVKRAGKLVAFPTSHMCARGAATAWCLPCASWWGPEACAGEAGAPSSASRGYLAAMDGFEAKLFPAASQQDPGPGGRAMRQVPGHAGSPRRRHAINTRVVVVGLCWKTGGIWESRGRWDEGSGSVVAGRRAACSPVGECEGRQLRQSSLQGPEGLRAGRRPAGRKLCKCNISVTM